MIKEITVFTVGDSTQIKTWSNVPYFFTKGLESKGYKVNRVNIEENKTLYQLYKFSFYAFLKLVYKKSNHTYFRSTINYYLTNKKIRKAEIRYANSDLSIFLTYSFKSQSPHSKPYVLFGDWTYAYYIQNFLKKSPRWFEKNTISREQKHIHNANLVLGLFPLSADYIQQNFQNKNVHYLGNVINSNYTLDERTILKEKITSKSILFIGNDKYINGAIELIEQFKVVKKRHTELTLDIIGLNEQEIGIVHPGINYHGYLDKGIETQNKLYYSLLSRAKVIVNTSDDWGGFSSITEAMYFYTPVITKPYPEFTETYGKDIDFGYFITNNASELENVLYNVFSNSENEQIKLMSNAHLAVKNFSWENYLSKFEKLLPK